MTGEPIMDQQKRDADDELLSALIDDALPAAEEDRLLERLRREPVLARRFDALQHADAAVRGAYAGIVEEPLPDRVLKLLSRPREGAENEKHDASIVPLASRTRALFALHVFSAPTAIAAGVALAIGFVSAFAILSQMRPPDAAQIIANGGVVERGTALYEVLQSRASAEAHVLDEQTTALPRMSFVTTTGNYCRQIDVTGARGTTYAIACRRGGDWQLELVSFDASTPAGTDGLYRAATNETPAPIQATINAMIDGDPLGRNAEQEAIARDWAP